MIWLRTVGAALSIAGVLSVLLIPMWGAGALLAAVGLILVGIVLLAVGTRGRQVGDRPAGGPYGNGTALDIGDGNSLHHGGTEGGHDGDGSH